MDASGRGPAPGGYAERFSRASDQKAPVHRELSFEPEGSPSGASAKVPYALHDGTDSGYVQRPYTASPNMFRNMGPEAEYPQSMKIPPRSDIFLPRSPFPYGPQKPMKGLKRLPPGDAAGLLQRWGGKDLPMRGHGAQHDHAGEIQASKGKRKNEHSHLLRTVHDRDILGFHGFQGVDDADNAHVFSKKMIPENPDLKGYKVCGANIQYLAPEDPERKVRGPGLPGKSYRVPTTARIMGRGEHMHPQEVDPDLNMRRQLKPGEIQPTEHMTGIVRNYEYGAPVMRELYGNFDRTKEAERRHYETRVLGGPSQAMSMHSSYYYQLYRARAHAPSSIFVEPLYEKRPQTAHL